MGSLLEEAEFAVNADQRLACILVLDTSGSMEGEKINALNAGLHQLKDALMNDPTGFAPQRVEVAILSFNNNIELVRDFALAEDWEPPVLVAGGLTYLGTAVLQALEHLEARKAKYRENSIPYNRPWLFLITDGTPQGEDPSLLEKAGQAVREAEANKHIVMWTVGVGDEVDYALLGRTFGKEPARLKGVEFEKMFKWLSASTARASASSSGEKVGLAPPDWASFEA